MSRVLEELSAHEGDDDGEGDEADLAGEVLRGGRARDAPVAVALEALTKNGVGEKDATRADRRRLDDVTR